MTHKPYFRLHGEPGAIYVTLHGGNGEKVAVSQAYKRRRSAYLGFITIACGPDSVDFENAAAGRPIRAWHNGHRAWLPIRDEVAKRRTVTP